MRQRMKRRYFKERLFKLLGQLSILLAAGFLSYLLLNIAYQGYGGFRQTYIQLDIRFESVSFEPLLQPDNEARDRAVRMLPTRRLVLDGLVELFPSVTNRRDQRQLLQMISVGAREQLIDVFTTDPALADRKQPVWLLADDNIDQAFKGNIDLSVPPENRRISDLQLAWMRELAAKDRIKTAFNPNFFTHGDSREPELAGIWGAVVGSFLTIAVTLVIAFPVGVLSAVYLEEFAHNSRATRLLEVNINNLASVPSIVFGLLGLSLFLGFFNMQRSAPLVGGLTLALMTLPTIIIASRSAIRSVPKSLRDAAAALGASSQQVVFHHIMPQAMPGILTGTIIGVARAIGETAPLLMIGMVAFVVTTPQNITDAATALPVQVYLWANSLERAFIEKTSAAILVLLMFLIALNLLAIAVRRYFAKKL